ncbi:hypothetical protein ZIOFF_038227 [Zingiber officinale]|uniref:CST complex subunit STN1 n=1 Tax=Zingiber officinale TaxID=94328 RepID=A0A8J5GG61_ZINOF|nr:hypothetical protein ZIOFF_038227 [Zingiber officinale]
MANRNRNVPTFRKIRANDFLALSIHTEPNSPPSFTTRTGIPVTLIEIVGRVVSLQRTDETLTFHLYDGSGNFNCIQFLHQHPESVVTREIAIRQAELVEARKQVQVFGKIGLSPDGALQLIGCSVMVEEGPNVETLHILGCMRQAEREYRR